MKGKDHLSISFIMGLIIITPWILSNTVDSMLFLIALLIGSLLPDADSFDRYAKHKSSILAITDLLTEKIFYPIIAGIFKTKKRHRGILHTIHAVLILSLLLTIITIIGYFIISGKFFNIIIIFIGFFSGGILHLIEDTCTVTGIKPLYPYSDKCVCGNINTFDLKNKHPRTFVKLSTYVFFTLIIGGNIIKLDQIQFLLITLFSILMLWSWFFYVSEVKIT